RRARRAQPPRAREPAAPRAPDRDRRRRRRACRTAAVSAPGGASAGEAVLVRHAETEWSVSGRHTGRTDIPLTEHGRDVARALRERLSHRRFELVLVSPSVRARETCELCDLDADARVRPDLLEWDYGDYEGLTTPEIRAQQPDWLLWRDGCPGGESPADVGA